MTAIKATLEDYKRIKTRGAWQIILEIPEHELPNAMTVLGNPLSGKSIWVGVARLEDDAISNNQPKETTND